MIGDDLCSCLGIVLWCWVGVSFGYGSWVENVLCMVGYVRRDFCIFIGQLCWIWDWLCSFVVLVVVEKDWSKPVALVLYLSKFGVVDLAALWIVVRSAL